MLAPDLLRKLDAYQTPPAGSSGHDAGLDFVYVYLNRAIKEHDLNVIYIVGPGMMARRNSSTRTAKSISTCRKTKRG